MTQKGRLQLHGHKWLDCEFSFSEVEKGYVLRILHPYRITLAVLKADQISPGNSASKQTAPNRPGFELARRLQNIPETVQDFLRRSKDHPLLGKGKYQRDIVALFGEEEEEEGRACAYVECDNIVTSSRRDYCSDACKQAAYRLRNAVTTVTDVTEEAA